MSVCKFCNRLSHPGRCAPRSMRGGHVAPPAPKQESRIEWTGNIQVHQPVRSAQ